MRKVLIIIVILIMFFPFLVDADVDSKYSYCVYYFYDGIININNTECYSNVSLNTTINTFKDKKRDGYYLKGYDPVTISYDDNVLLVYYEKEPVLVLKEVRNKLYYVKNKLLGIVASFFSR